MAKVHPNAAESVQAEAEGELPTVLTVWRKSLLFNCDGFTVYDARGDLAFRVDCYAGSFRRRRRADVVLMDATGKPLLTVRRKTRLGLAERWVIYDGDADADDGTTAGATPLLSVRRRRIGACCKTLALARPRPAAAGTDAPSYVVEGSYGRRACAVRDARGGAVVAEVQKKEAVGDDVFRLVVAGQRLGAPLSMALVIALDDMFRGGWSARSLLRMSSPA
jgi:uncharacterized protein YxjI